MYVQVPRLARADVAALDHVLHVEVHMHMHMYTYTYAYVYVHMYMYVSTTCCTSRCPRCWPRP